MTFDSGGNALNKRALIRHDKAAYEGVGATLELLLFSAFSWGCQRAEGLERQVFGQTGPVRLELFLGFSFFGSDVLRSLRADERNVSVRWELGAYGRRVWGK